MLDGMCVWVVRFVGYATRVTVVLVTLITPCEVCMRSTKARLSVGIACSGDAKVGGPLSSGAIRLVVSLIGEGIEGGVCFGTLRFHFSVRLVGSSLLGPGDL